MPQISPDDGPHIWAVLCPELMINNAKRAQVNIRWVCCTAPTWAMSPWPAPELAFAALPDTPSSYIFSILKTMTVCIKEQSCPSNLYPTFIACKNNHLNSRDHLTTLHVDGRSNGAKVQINIIGIHVHFTQSKLKNWLTELFWLAVILMLTISFTLVFKLMMHLMHM